VPKYAAAVGEIDKFIFDLLDSFNLAMASEGIDAITRSAVLLTVEDSIVNNIPEDFNA